ncbi:uncharacterized protein LOC126743687 [Anthonomus grandis grandis]|uniref:uncharacterized protein LOC126743687 n=1 Tax=Anthonomus grandis grandis TaxID=2921223 RepID=UPI00216600E6|nr:uncharacterized protein LOC126743687 [Anthonomus grandis grandis]
MEHVAISWGKTFDGTIEFVSLTKSRLKEALEVLKTSFYPQENVCKATGLAFMSNAMEECKDMVMGAAKCGVSIIAIDKITQKVVGVLLNKIQHKDTSSKKLFEKHIKNTKYDQVKGLYEFLLEMEEKVNPFSPYQADCLLEMVFLGVPSEYARRGIGFGLCKASIDLAKCLYKGENVKTSLTDTPLPLQPVPQIVTVFFTTYKSQGIGRKLNMDILEKVSCDELFFRGKSYASILGNETEYFTIECQSLKV